MKRKISNCKWTEKYQDDFINKHLKEETNLDLFHFVVNRLDIYRIRILMNCGLSNFNKSHIKIINKINDEFEDLIENRLCELLHIKKLKKVEE